MSVGYQMHAVGHHLQKQAIAATSHERDAFARSSFNRYYYGAFLNIRTMLTSLNPAWSQLRHKDYPDLLRGTLRKNLNAKRTQARKKNDTRLIHRINEATRAIDALAKTLTAAYGIRVVADYEPAELVTFDEQNRFSLRSINISDAHDWENNSRLLCETIDRAWREANA